MRVLAGQMLVFLEGVNSSNERPPTARSFIISTITGTFRSQVNQFQRSVCSKMFHEPHAPSPALRRDSIIMKSRAMILHHFESNANPTDGFVQYFLGRHFGYPCIASLPRITGWNI